MPKYNSDLKPGEKLGGVDIDYFNNVLKIKSAFGPEDKDGNMKWNRCWSELPKEWVERVTQLISDIRAKYRVESTEDQGGEPEIQVIIEQVKCKFGSLRFYFATRGEKSREIMQDIDSMVEECEKDLQKIDPTYGVPY